MKRAVVLACAAVTLVATSTLAQLPLFELPRLSPAASVTQRIGLTDITVAYHRPGVKGRVIWGQLVLWDRVWRAGANENTTVTFSTPVTVGGKKLDAGTYGLHMIPSQTYWIVILSYQHNAWGSFSYDEAEDAVRVTISPEETAFQERLLYTINDITDDSCVISLRWKKVKVSFPVEVNVNAVVVEYLENGLRGLPQFTWRGWQQAAEWCVQNDTHLDLATGWIERSIRMNRNFANVGVKASLLEKQGATKEADALMAEVMTMATEVEINAYGYQLVGQGRLDRAITIFELNARDNPDSWNVYDSLAEAYVARGDTKKAILNYEKALSIVEDPRNKQRIETMLARLK
jgi:tetratricopeptide (TPR) repeat protein